MASRTISTAAEEVLPRNRLRKSWIISNEDTAIAVFLKRERNAALTVSSTDHDHRVGAGGIIALNFGTDGDEAIQDRWTIIAASGTPRIAFFETEEVVR